MNIKKISPTLLAEKRKGNITALIKCRANCSPLFNASYVRKIDYFPFLHIYAVSAPLNLITELADDSYVQYVTSVEKSEVCMNLVKSVINADALNANGLNGEGQVLATLDSGVIKHLDLTAPKSRILEFYDVLSGNTSPYDDNGHGTMIAGVAVGNGFSSAGKFAGIAPKAELVAVKCMKKDGSGNSIDILRGMQWIYDNKARLNISVVCMAFGAKFLGSFDPLVQGAETLVKSGLTVVAAAGNERLGGIKSPGAAPSVITVGSYDDNRTKDKNDDFLAPFSAIGPSFYGEKPDFLYPGVDICCPDKSALYKTFSGTSVSAGIASGAALLIKQRFGNVSCKRVKEIMRQNAYKKGYGENEEGDGFVYF